MFSCALHPEKDKIGIDVIINNNTSARILISTPASDLKSIEYNNFEKALVSLLKIF